MTGSMRPWTVIGADAQANLFKAVVTAATSTLRMDTFQTPEFGVLGYVEDPKVRVFRATPAPCGCSRAWPGGRSPARVRGVGDAGEGVVFVSTSRTGPGGVYGGSGSVIPGDAMHAQHARLLLMSLAFTHSAEDPRETFVEWSATEADSADLVPELPRGFDY